MKLGMNAEFDVEADEGEDAEAMRETLEFQTARWHEVLEANLFEHLQKHVPGVTFSCGDDEGEEWKG